MGILFINGGEIGGNTAHLGHAFLEGRDFMQIDLASLKVYDYGTHFADDQFDEVLEAMKAADTIVIGSPVYWHDMSGMTRCLLDRCYGPVSSDDLAGKRLFFLFQGGAPTQQMYERGEYTINRFAGLYGMDYMGMARNASEARALAAKL